MYQALYRKYRPRVFEEVSGQPHITRTLKNELKAGRIAHAYLFTGSRGTGKTTCAKILAKAVNCLDPNDGNPCNACENCLSIDNGSLLDVLEIDAASNNGVDNIRELREEAFYTPASAKYRVYIIDEAHMLSTGAFNALLKTLEEPPAHVIFILATTEVHKIPATILSRCQRFDFQRIPEEEIASRLVYVANEEHLELTEGAAQIIARLADGALRDALSLLDRCAGGNGLINEEAVERAAGLSGREYLFELSRAIRTGDSGLALTVLDRLYAESKDVERLCGELIAHFRGIMVLKALPDASGSLLNLPPDENEKLAAEAAGFSGEAVLHVLDTLAECLDSLRKSPSRRVEMEMALLRLCNPLLDDSNSAILRRIAALEEKLRAAAFTAAARPADAPSSPPVSAQVPESAAREEKPAAAPLAKTACAEEQTPLDCWPEILEVLSRTDPALRGFLNDSAAVLRGDYVLVDSSNSMFGELIRHQSHQKPLVEAVRGVTGRPYKVGILKKNLRKTQPGEDPMDEILRAASAGGINIKEK